MAFCLGLESHARKAVSVEWNTELATPDKNGFRQTFKVEDMIKEAPVLAPRRDDFTYASFTFISARRTILEILYTQQLWLIFQCP